MPNKSNMKTKNKDAIPLYGLNPSCLSLYRLGQLKINGHRLPNLVLLDREKVIKDRKLFQKTTFLQKSYHFLQNLKIGGIFT